MGAFVGFGDALVLELVLSLMNLKHGPLVLPSKRDLIFAIG